MQRQQRDGGSRQAGESTPGPRKTDQRAPDAADLFAGLSWHYEDYSSLRWSSHDLGWTSLLVREFENAAVVESAEIPPIPDQQIVLVLEGPSSIASRRDRGWFQARDFPGKIGLTAPWTPVELRWDSASARPLRRLHVHVPGQLLADAAAELWGLTPEQVPAATALATVDPVLEGILRGLRRAAASGAPDLYAQSAAQFLVVHTLTQHTGRMPRPADLREDRRVDCAVRFMQECLSEPLTLDDIAAAARLSRFHFSRVFSAAKGRSPMRYLTDLRIDAVRRHLERTELSVDEIARACGFVSSSYLAAVFGQRMGVSPSSYRAACRPR